MKALILFLLLTSVAYAADKKITEYPADASPTTDDLIVTVNNPGGSPSNRKVTVGNFLKESNIQFTDVTTNNVSTDKHGYAPKLPGDATLCLDGTGNWSACGGGGGSGSVGIGTAGIVPEYLGAAAIGPSGTLRVVNGNVGVGSATPNAKLAVTGTGYYSGPVTIAGTSTITFNGNGETIANTVDGYNNFSGGITTAGNVGVGSITPGTALDVSGTVRATSFVGDGSALTGIAGGGMTESEIEAVVDLEDLQGAVTDAQVPNSITITNLSGTNTGDQSESSIEALVDLQDLQGAVTDAQVPNDITITETNTLTTATGIADDQLVVGTAANTGAYKTLTDCDDTAGKHLNYDATTNTFSCGTSGDGSGSGTAAGGTNAVQFNSGAGTFAGDEADFSFNGNNMGIGTSNAPSKFIVTGGNVGIGTTLIATGTAAANSSAGGTAPALGGRMTLVGIGTTTQTSSLQVRDGSGNLKMVIADNGSVGMAMGPGASTNAVYVDHKVNLKLRPKFNNSEQIIGIDVATEQNGSGTPIGLLGTAYMFNTAASTSSGYGLFGQFNDTSAGDVTTGTLAAVYGKGYLGAAINRTNPIYGGLFAAAQMDFGTATRNFALGAVGPTMLNGNVGIGTSSTDAFLTQSPNKNGSLSMYGNLGIGTWTTTKELHVVGDARVSGLIDCDSIDTDSSGNLACGTDATGGGGSSQFITSAVGIGTTGNVGVGSLSPGSRLDVVWGSNNTGANGTRFFNSSNVLKSYMNDRGGQGWYLQDSSGNEVGTISYTTPSALPGIVFFNASGTGRTQFRYLATTGGLAFGSSSASTDPGVQIVMDNSKMGINTSTLTNTLNVVGGTSIGGSVSAAPSNGLIVSGNTGIGTTVPATLLEVGARRFNVSSAGNVGIGTFNHGNALTILNGNLGIGTTSNSRGAIEIIQPCSNNSCGLTLVNPTLTGSNRNFTNANGEFEFDAGAGGTGDFRFVGAGPDSNVGIGTTTNAIGSRLSIYGGLSVGATAFSTAAPANGALISGNVGIGSLAPGAALDVQGAGRFSSTVTADSFVGTSPDGYSSTTGNLGIGSTAPGSAIDIFSGTVRAIGIGTHTSGTAVCWTAGKKLGYCTGTWTGTICSTCTAP